jgi:3D (Asp-Asp-Asp) domain-containing protein
VGKPVSAGMTIKVTTVREITETVEEPIEYVSLIQYDSQLATGQRMIAQGGEDGAVHREYRVRSINGQETRRELVSETITPATDEVVSIGTYVRPAPAAVAAAVAAPAPVASVGDMVCSRTLNVYATWYTAASAGGSGITATGTGVYKGIVAVDPRVIPLGTRMYIPGYGYATAADTGGAIRGNHIDLGYGADDVKDWRTRWVDICIL